MTSMRDVIDERDAKDRISKSIIKFWNVNYVPVPQTSEAEEEAESDACEQEECEEDAEQESEGGEHYNMTTGAYSGKYGADGACDEVTKGQIDRILQEKNEALRSLIENTGDYFWEEE